MLRIYPAAGLKTRDPVSKRLVPETGLDIDPNNLYWARRIADGSVTTKAPVISTNNSAQTAQVSRGGSSE